MVKRGLTVPTDDPAWRLAMEHEGLAHRVAVSLWNSRGCVRRLGSLDDVVQEAMILLVRAAGRYGDGNGISCAFTTIAYKVIRRGLMEAGCEAGVVRVPAPAAFLAFGRNGFRGGRRVLRDGVIRKALAALNGPCRMGTLAEGPSARRPRDDSPDLEGLRLALARLPEGDRDLVGRLFGLDGRPAEGGEEAAARLGVTRQEVNRRLDKARSRLRGYMTGTFWDWDEAG